MRKSNTKRILAPDFGFARRSDGLREGEGPGAELLRLLLVPQVHAAVPLALVTARKPLPAHVARERLLAGVRASVRGEMVAAAKAARAHAAPERLVARVDADVPIELIRA